MSDRPFSTTELDDLTCHAILAQDRYGNYASTHEALGVALEEWTELVNAVHANDIEAVRDEAIDLAAVLLRLAYQCRWSEAMKARSVK